MIKNEETPEREIDTNSSVKFTAGIMKDAPVLILVLKEYDEDWKTGDVLSIGYRLRIRFTLDKRYYIFSKRDSKTDWI